MCEWRRWNENESTSSQYFNSTLLEGDLQISYYPSIESTVEHWAPDRLAKEQVQQEEAPRPAN